jgi:hypothetical protein
MTENTKVIEALENTFHSNIDDWVKEVMFDYKLENKVCDKETIKKILKFGYYTGVYSVEEIQ